MLEVGKAGRKADRALGGQEGKCLGDDVVAVVHGGQSMVRVRCSKGIARSFGFVLYFLGTAP